MTAPGAPRTIGRWVVEGELGRGGMGVVFQARDPSSGRVAAVKVMLDPDDEGQARFDRELQAMERLDHPGIVKLYERGRADGRVYAAMELVEGGPLPERLELDDVFDVGLQVARALEHAHARGILHRDLKPSNILRLASGQVKLLDFGLARLSDRSRLTRTGATLGTPAYMPPEQVEGKADVRSDVYGLGATLYALLTGGAPFRGGTLENLLVKVLTQAPPGCSSVREDVPPGLDALVLRCLAKEPAQRPQSATAVIELLEALQAGEDSFAAARRRRTVVLAAALVMGVVVLLGGLAGAFAIRRQRRQAAEAAARADAEAGKRAAAEAEAERAARVLEAEALWLRGDLERVQAAADASGPRGATLRALLQALAPETAAQADAALASVEQRPAVRTGRLAAAGLTGRRSAAATAFGPPVDATPLAAALLERGQLEAALAIGPWAALHALPPAAEAALGRGLRELLVRDPTTAARLLRSVAAGLSPALRAALVAEQRVRYEAVEETLPTAPGGEDAQGELRRGLLPYRPLLVLDPALFAARPPEALLQLSALVLPTLPGDRDRVAIDEATVVVGEFHAQNKALYDSGRQAAERPALIAKTVERLEAARELAATPFGRSEVCCLAVDTLCHQDESHTQAVQWAERACKDQVVPELDRYRAVLAFALQVDGRPDEALRLLDEAIDDDPIDGDPLHIRALVRQRLPTPTNEELALAASDARRAAIDRRLSRSIRMRGGYENSWLTLAELEERRGDLEAAWDASAHFGQDPASGDAYHRTIRARLEARLGR